MRSFLVKIGVFTVLVIGLNSQTVRFLPDGWENRQEFAKYKTFKERYQSSTNTLFFGSSRTLRHVDPVLFDSLNAINGIQTHSFNLGISAAMFNEQCYILDRYFSDASAIKNLAFLFLELDDYITIAPENVGTTKVGSYLNTSTIKRVLMQLAVSTLPMLDKLRQCWYHIVTMMTHKAYMGQARVTLNALFFSQDIPDIPRDSLMGYSPIDWSLPQFQHGDFVMRHMRLMADTTIIQRNFRYNNAFNTESSGGSYNPMILERYLSFIARMQKQGVQVICMIPIRGTISKDLLSLYRAIPEGHKINMTANPGIQSLNYAKYWFDTGHLNKDGAQIYTQLLSKEFGQVVSKFNHSRH